MYFMITISEEDEDKNVFVRVEELRDGKFHLIDSYETSSQMCSSMLVYEREKVERGDYLLEIRDFRKNFMMC